MRRLVVLALLLFATGTLQRPGLAGGPGEFKTYTYDNAKGTLTYKVYTPPTGGPRPRSLVVVLPGAGETSDVAATHSRFNTVAQQLNFVVAYPEQNLDYNSSREWDWATASKEGRDNREASLIAGITQTVIADQHLDPSRVFVMGISAGAGMASAMAVAFPDLYDGLGIEAGCPFDNAGCGGGSVTADQSAAAAVKAMGGFARRLPVFNEYGTIDPIAVGVSSDEVVPSWLSIDDILDNGSNDGSVSRTPSASRIVTPAPPDKPYRVTEFSDNRGCELAQDWVVVGETHAWAGGAQTDPADVSADPLAPDVSTAMYRFFTDPQTLGASKDCAA